MNKTHIGDMAESLHDYCLIDDDEVLTDDNGTTDCLIAALAWLLEQDCLNDKGEQLRDAFLSKYVTDE